MLLNRALLVAPDVFESLTFHNDFKCKLLFYMSRVMRGLSICTTCLLGVLQAITTSPNTPWLAKFKHKSTSLILSSFFFWCLCLLFSSNLIFYTVASSNVTKKNLIISKCCSISSMNSIIGSPMLTLTIFRDVSFVGIMLLSSAHMENFLSRHQRQSQYLHSTRVLPRISPEQRATQTILLLVSFFVVMYWMNFIISSSLILLRIYDPVFFSVQSFIVNVYVTVSPFVLMSSDKKIANIFKIRQ
ncbi:vomeronasal type-1 receptor 90-like [Rhynchocyon petersi]